MPTDNYVFDTKGKYKPTEAVQKAIKFGIDKELPKLKTNEKLEVNIHVKEEGVVVDVLRVNKNKES